VAILAVVVVAPVASVAMPLQSRRDAGPALARLNC